MTTDVFPADLMHMGEEFLTLCRRRGLKICTAESCTGGLVIALLTEFPGSSDVVERGFVTYSNAAKQEQLGVASSLLAAFGAVSDEVARAMAEGALSVSSADMAIAITGIAGPGGGSPEKPVGLVYFACARRDYPTLSEHRVFSGQTRSGVRIAAVRTALELAKNQAEAAGLRSDLEGLP
jgi:nicotinamide-nucleotide amidase